MAAVSICGGLGAAFVLLPKPACCEKEGDELSQLTAKAANGDLAAISALFAQAKRDGILPMEEHWALEGGMRGEIALRKAFAKYYIGMDQGRQQRILNEIRQRIAMPGAQCVLQSLGDPQFAKIACD